jgi:hypothetical protein
LDEEMDPFLLALVVILLLAELHRRRITLMLNP